MTYGQKREAFKNIIADLLVDQFGSPEIAFTRGELMTVAEKIAIVADYGGMFSPWQQAPQKTTAEADHGR